MPSWLDHLLNDPMNENPWSMLLLVGSLAVLFGVSLGPTLWRTRRRRNAKDT